jgi:hypothetical protein
VTRPLARPRTRENICADVVSAYRLTGMHGIEQSGARARGLRRRTARTQCKASLRETPACVSLPEFVRARREETQVLTSLDAEESADTRRVALTPGGHWRWQGSLCRHGVMNPAGRAVCEVQTSARGEISFEGGRRALLELNKSAARTTRSASTGCIARPKTASRSLEPLVALIDAADLSEARDPPRHDH